MYPKFPDFKPIELEDRGYIKKMFSEYQPECSEYTFTNLFIWRNYYGIKWSVYKECLLFICDDEKRGKCAWQPVGPGPREEAGRALLEWLRDEKTPAAPYMIRVGGSFIREVEGGGRFEYTADRDNCDYVYRTEDLISLYGKKYHSKRNHINKFLRSNTYKYLPMNADHVRKCLRLIEEWCAEHRCSEDLSLMAEWEAVNEALRNFDALELQGAVILVRGDVKAFTLGEMLNADTAVVHVEKASPEYPALYTIINHDFCENAWSRVPFINREQDLGAEGLRQAKQSYHPHHMVEKYRVSLARTSG